MNAHPLSRMIQSSIVENEKVSIRDLEEVPGKGIKARVGEENWEIGSADWLGTNRNDNRTRVYISKNKEVLGSFIFANKYRPNLGLMFEELKKKYSIHILSGDNSSEREALKELTSENTPLIFNQKPEDKLEYIKDLQLNGKRVAMLGDGLNDAGALKQSDIGISVVDDVYSFSPASDGILTGENLTKLNSFLQFTAYNKGVVKLSYVFSVLYNVTGLVFALSGHLTPLVAAILMPLSSISVVLLVTILVNVKEKSLK